MKEEKVWKCPKCGKTLPRFIGEANITCPECNIFMEVIVIHDKVEKKLEKLEG